MTEKNSFQYFSNISQRCNLINDEKLEDNSRETSSINQEKNDAFTTNVSSGWFASLKNKKRNKLQRKISCTNSEGANSIVSNGYSINEKAVSISSLQDVRKNNELSTQTLQRFPEKSNRSNSKIQNVEWRKKSKEEENLTPLYYRYSSPEPESDLLLVPNYDQYINQFFSEKSNQQLNSTDFLITKEQLKQTTNQNNIINQPINSNQALIHSNFIYQPNQHHHSNLGTQKSLKTNFTEQQEQPSSLFSSFVEQSEQCPQLNNNLGNNTNYIELNKFSELQKISELPDRENQLNKQSFSNQLNTISNELVSLEISESKSDNQNFELVKELFSSNAHLFMSVEQMAVMEDLLRNNPRTCIINLKDKNEELGFNLKTKSKPSLAHLVVKVNPNLVSAKAGLQENDQILTINNVDCRKFNHQQVVKQLKKKDKKLKLVVCQPSVYQWYLSEGYELKLDYDEEEDTQNFNENFNERSVDDEPIQIIDESIPYVDSENKDITDNYQYKDNDPNQLNLIKNNQSSFKRNYKNKKQNEEKAKNFFDSIKDDTHSLNTSTGASVFDEHYGVIRDDIFGLNHSSKKKFKDNNFNFESKNIEYNEYMDSNSHKLEKLKTTVEISNNDFEKKKITTKSVEKIVKSYDEIPVKNVLQTKSFNEDNIEEKKETVKSTKRPSIFSASIFDKPFLSSRFSSTIDSFKNKNNVSATNNCQTLVKEPYIERLVIKPKEAQLVEIIDGKEKKKEDIQQTEKPIEIEKKNVELTNSSNILPSPRMCTLKLPKNKIASFGFTIKTCRKTNQKQVVDILHNSIAQRAGVRINDVIVEVNEENIFDKTHRQVTERIKALSEDEVRLLVVSEAEMNFYASKNIIPSSKQSNVIYVEYNTEITMPDHPSKYEDDDCIKGCGSFLDNLTAKQYRNYLMSNKKRPETTPNKPEFQEKIKKFEKL